MPVLRVLGAALTAVFLSAVPAMAQGGPTIVNPCESPDSAPPGGVTTTPGDVTATPGDVSSDDAGSDGTASETSATEGVSTITSPDTLVFGERLGAIPPADCEEAPSTGLPGIDTPLGAVQDSADQLVEMLAII
ncbi:MAG: hypothetical protein ACRDZO_00110 [Egibacteraceae bacterium]